MTSGLRVLRVYHSAVVSEFRQRDRLLRSRHGHDIHLVCPPMWDEGGSRVAAMPDPDVPLHIVRAHGREHPILFWYDSKQFRAVLREVRPDIVDLHEEPYSLAVASALRAIRSEAPDAAICMYTAQNIFKRYPPPFRELERRALRTADAAYPCSTEAGGVLRRKGFQGQVNVVPLGVTIEDRPQRRFEDRPLIVGFVGRLEPYKGGHIALRAFADATAEVNASMEVVGTGSQEQELSALARELRIDHRVTFTGAVSQEEALKRIASYDVIMVPSLTTKRWKEQFGRIPVQAMESGTPVIASASGSLTEVLGSCGILAAEGDVRAFATSLESLLSSSKLRADLSRLGRDRAVAEFAWQKVADDFASMYARVVASRETP